jgi:endonuclease YncB( thermonuclease family)
MRVGFNLTVNVVEPDATGDVNCRTRQENIGRAPYMIRMEARAALSLSRPVPCRWRQCRNLRRAPCRHHRRGHDSQGTERVRLLNVDAPESFRPRCEAELIAGLKAKERLAQLVRAGSVRIDRQGQDRYRRTLARLNVGLSDNKSRDVSEILIKEGLALPWRDGRTAWEARKRHWCG